MSRYYHTITVDNYKFQFDYSITTLPGCCGIGVIYNFRVDYIYDLDSGESLHPKDVEDGIIPEKTLSRFKSRVRQTLSRSAKARYSMVMASDVEYARDIS